MSNISSIASSLNGWQRSWVLFTIIWLFAIIVYNFSSFPTEAREISTAMESHFSLFPHPKIDYACDLDKPEYKECMEFIFEENRRSAEYVKGESERIYANTKENLIYVQSEFLGKLIAVWIFSSFGLYVFGLGISWVFLGFKKATGNPQR